QRVVIFIGQAKTFICQIAAKNKDTRLEMFEEFWEVKMQLKRSPKPLARFLFRFCSHQQVQLVAVSREKSRHHIAAQIAGRAGDEDRHISRTTARLWKVLLAEQARCSRSIRSLAARGTPAAGLPSAGS